MFFSPTRKNIRCFSKLSSKIPSFSVLPTSATWRQRTSKGTVPLSPPRPSVQLAVEFLGDSITAGYQVAGLVGWSFRKTGEVPNFAEVWGFRTLIKVEVCEVEVEEVPNYQIFLKFEGFEDFKLDDDEAFLKKNEGIFSWFSLADKKSDSSRRKTRQVDLRDLDRRPWPKGAPRRMDRETWTWRCQVIVNLRSSLSIFVMTILSL